jgi:F0F1-type ATP synthase assembly protein I
MLLGSGAEIGMHRWQAALNIIGIGWFVGLSLMGGMLGGLWLDSKLNTEPLFVVVGLVLGFTVAGYGVYQMLLPLLRNKNDKENN